MRTLSLLLLFAFTLAALAAPLARAPFVLRSIETFDERAVPNLLERDANPAPAPAADAQPEAQPEADAEADADAQPEALIPFVPPFPKFPIRDLDGIDPIRGPVFPTVTIVGPTVTVTIIHPTPTTSTSTGPGLTFTVIRPTPPWMGGPERPTLVV